MSEESDEQRILVKR